MKTNQIMKREFYDTIIEQRTKDGFFNATSLLKYYNKKIGTRREFKEFFRNKNTKRFLEELEFDLRGENSTPAKSNLFIMARNQHYSTWMHPYLFVKFAMWLSPKFEVQVIKFVYDNLINYRIKIGDQYKDMCREIDRLYRSTIHPSAVSHLFIRETKVLNRLVFGTPDGSKRNEANEQQLVLMGHLQRANTKLLKQGVPLQKRFEMLHQFAEMYR